MGWNPGAARDFASHPGRAVPPSACGPACLVMRRAVDADSRLLRSAKWAGEALRCVTGSFVMKF